MIYIAASIMAILLAAVAVVVLLDAVPAFGRWYGRIGMGSFTDNRSWRNAATAEAIDELKKTPAVPVSGNTRLTVIDRLNGSYKNKKLQSWQEGALLMGINAACDNPDAMRAATSFIETKIEENGDWKAPPVSVDFALLAFAVLSSPVCNCASVRPAMDAVYKLLVDSVSDGTIPYNADKSVRFVDTVGMVCPFLFAYAEKYGVPDAAELARRQLTEYLECGMDSKTFLPFHCFDKRSGAPLGICGWGRGCGWLALGLGGSIAVTQGEEREKLILTAKKYADALGVFRNNDGSWSRRVTVSGDIGETSATAMIGYLLRTLNNVSGDDKYLAEADAAVTAIARRTRKNGRVDYAQGDTIGIGFYSLRLDALPAAQGFALLAAY